MKRRTFFLGMTGLPLAHAGRSFAAEAETGPPKITEYCRVIMVDPRVTIPPQTSDVFTVFGNTKVDVMGSVYLSVQESAKLQKVLDTALTNQRPATACGHFPAYVIMPYVNGKPIGNHVSVCGLCMTWADSKGGGQHLEHKELMPILTKILPLPAAFLKVQTLKDLLSLGTQSHLELASPK